MTVIWQFWLLFTCVKLSNSEIIPIRFKYCVQGFLFLRLFLEINKSFEAYQIHLCGVTAALNQFLLKHLRIETEAPTFVSTFTRVTSIVEMYCVCSKFKIRKIFLYSFLQFFLFVRVENEINHQSSGWSFVTKFAFLWRNKKNGTIQFLRNQNLLSTHGM